MNLSYTILQFFIQYTRNLYKYYAKIFAYVIFILYICPLNVNSMNNNDPNEDSFSKLLEAVIEDKGGKPEDYLQLLDSIAYHESAGTMDPRIKQYSGGPGRGKYQFEGKGGSNRILSSAIRTKRYYRSKGLMVPTFVQEIINKGTEDASILSSEQQDILALGDLRMKKGLDLKDYIDGKLKVEDLWADHWWAGSKDQRDKKIKSFRNSLSKRNNLNQSKYAYNQPQDNNIKNDNLTNTVSEKVDNLRVIQKDLRLPQFNETNTDFISNHINEFNTGGTHEQNSLGGIPQGVGNNGKMNTVEQGEASFELPEGKYIFSNRLKL